MHPQDEARIERYVRFPATLAPAEHAAIAALLAADPAARAVASFFRSFYEELDGVEVDLEPPSPQAARKPRTDLPESPQRMTVSGRSVV